MEVGPAVLLRGDLAVPGDKSISHRALLFGAVADGESRFTGFGASADTLSTAAGMRAARPHITTFASVTDQAGLMRLSRMVRLRA